jgi:hypothetical protein
MKWMLGTLAGVAVLATAAVALTGSDDEARIRETVSRFQDAVLAGRGGDACALMTRAGVDGVAATSEQLARHFEGADPGEDCAQYLTRVSDGGARSPVRKVEITGDEAHVRLTDALDGIGTALPLRKVDGDWRLDLFAGDASDSAYEAPEACVDSWNAAAAGGRIATWRWSELPPEGVWADLQEFPEGCNLVVMTPTELVAFREQDGWRQNGPSLPRTPGEGVRNVWLAADGTMTAVAGDAAGGEVECGEVQVDGLSEPLVATGANLDCDTIRQYVVEYAERRSLPPGWDESGCGASSLSCENGDRYFRGDPVSEAG